VVHDKTVVCEKHFSEQFIIRVDSVTRDDGSVLSVPRQRPKLIADAYPSLFPNTPSYLSSEPARKRRTPEDRLLDQSARDDQQFQQWLADDNICSFDVFDEKLAKFIADNGSPWSIIRSDGCICLCTVDLSDVPKIVCAIKVLRDLSVQVYRGQYSENFDSLKWLLGDELKLSCWSQLSSLLSHFSSCGDDVDTVSVQSRVNTIVRYLQDLIEVTASDDQFNDDTVSRLKFLREQVSLLFMSASRYSADTLLIAFRLFVISASVYNRLRSSVLSLPHVSYLKRLSSVFSLSSGLQDNEHAHYLQEKAQVLQPHERHVMLLLDEIYVNPKTTYKGGSVSGAAVNSPGEEATTVQTFMICSLLSANKEVVAMVPVKSLTAEYLKTCTLKVLGMLDKVGFNVFCLLSDNNRVNRNMFAELCGGTLTPYTAHPVDSSKRLFFLFDSVHLLKCVRNNWLGQSDSDCTFVFPDISDGSLCKASLSHVRSLYAAEKDCFIKEAPGLSHKYLYPSNLERQNVQLVLKLFSDKTIVGLTNYGVKSNLDVSGTTKFMTIILRLWNVLNVKSTDKGRCKRDASMDPIRSVNDDNVCFLRSVHEWLVKWEGLQQKLRQGRLSNETLFALKHTVATFVELINYLFADLRVSYVLTGKFQTDCLEFRFSQYRQLSGANYHVSVQQLKESEKKLKVISMLHVVLASRGCVSLREFVSRTSVTSDDSCDDDTAILGLNDFLPALDLCDDMTVTESESHVLVFIAGYVGFKVLSRITCDLCKGELVQTDDLKADFAGEDFEYLVSISRGGLKWPTDFLVEVITQVYIVFKTIVADESKFRNLFLSNISHQKSLLMKLCITRLSEVGTNVGECACGTTMQRLSELCLPHACNIFLNNFCKQAADKRQSTKQTGKRKLATLTHK